jgi:hypothetical protein
MPCIQDQNTGLAMCETGGSHRRLWTVIPSRHSQTGYSKGGVKVGLDSATRARLEVESPTFCFQISCSCVLFMTAELVFNSSLFCQHRACMNMCFQVRDHASLSH